MVPQSYQSGGTGSGNRFKPFIASHPAGLFQGHFSQLADFLHIHPLQLKRKLVASGEFLDKSRITIRLLASQTMIQVGNNKVQAQLCQRGENIQQGNGIRTSGNGDDHPVTMAEQTIIPNSFRNLSQHWIRSQ
jgi:hypothetical protein